MSNKVVKDRFKPTIGRDAIDKILKLEGIPLEWHKKFIDKNYQEKKLESLKTVLPVNKLINEFQGRIDEYKAISHHIWLTNMEKPRDIMSYVSDVFKDNKYNPNKVLGHIDHKDNAFIGSILNLERGAAESKLPLSDNKFHHILWTNYSRQDLIDHPELKDLRKICKIDLPERELPEFVVINIHDVINNSLAISNILDQATSSQTLPKSILNLLPGLRQDLNSISDTIYDLEVAEKFATISDVLRVAVVKDMGGIYFDIDYNFFEQTRLHKYKQYNLFDFMKHYDSVVGREMPIGRLCNAIISAAKQGSKVVTSIWEVVKRNITDPDSVYYVKYPKNDFDKIICQTGPIAATVGFLKAEGEYDIALDYGALYYNNFKRPAHELELEGSVGAIGYDTWGGTWLNCKYKDYKDYKCYDSETNRFVTEDEWDAMPPIKETMLEEI